MGGNLTLGDNSVIRLALGDASSHSSLIRSGLGTWTFDSNQLFSIVDAGASIGTYDNVISGLSVDPGVTSWLIGTAGFTGTFTHDGAGGVDLTLALVPEPGVASALIASVGVLLGLNRRRKN